MNFQFYVEKLGEMDKYKEFMKAEPTAVPCSGFFIIDYEGNDNQQHIDFYIKDKNKMISFKLESGELVPLEYMGNTVPPEIDFELDLDFDAVRELIEKRMVEEKAAKSMKKVIFSLQRKDKKHFLLGTVFFGVFGLVKTNVCVEEMKIINFEKMNLMDLIKVKKKDE